MNLFLLMNKYTYRSNLDSYNMCPMIFQTNGLPQKNIATQSTVQQHELLQRIHRHFPKRHPIHILLRSLYRYRLNILCDYTLRNQKARHFLEIKLKLHPIPQDDI
ncbi:hypothetical protein D3C78_1539680 [compost metagenome]